MGHDPWPAHVRTSTFYCTFYCSENCHLFLVLSWNLLVLWGFWRNWNQWFSNSSEEASKELVFVLRQVQLSALGPNLLTHIFLIGYPHPYHIQYYVTYISFCVWMKSYPYPFYALMKNDLHPLCGPSLVTASWRYWVPYLWRGLWTLAFPIGIFKDSNLSP